MRLTRGQVIAGAAGAAAVGAAGIYELVDQLTSPPPRAAPAVLPSEQHLLDGVRVVRDNGVEVLVPPLHHQVVTATVALREDPHELRAGQAELEYALTQIERDFPPSPAGIGVTLAWGLPYFRRFVPGAAATHLPHDRRAGRGALLDAIRFPSDPDDTILEANDVAVLLRSDSLEHIAEAARLLFEQSKVFTVTSIRRGFAGGGFEGGRSLPKRMALAAGIPGADLIPDTAELFLGFTSTQRAGLGPDRIANLETLGYADLRDSGYFRRGTHLHLSHIDEDVEAWYLNFDFRERVDTMFRPNLEVAPGTQTVAQGPEDTSTPAEVRQRLQADGADRPQRLDPVELAAAAGRGRRRRRRLPQGDGRAAAGRLQHARQPVRLERAPRAGRHGGRALGGRALRRLQPDLRRLPSQPARDGRRPAGGAEAAVPAAGARAGLQRRAADDAPAELPRAAARAPLLPAGGAARMTPRAGALALTTFVAGGVTLGVEIAASRVLSPSFGSSLYVWGSLIGVVLAGLAVGYWAGGALADRAPAPLLLAGTVLLGGALVLAIPFVDERVLAWVTAWDPGPRADPLVASLVLFGPPSVVLAGVTPIAVRLLASDVASVGRTAGRLFAVSTAGSIAGTFATAFYLVPELGTDDLFVYLAAALFLAAVPAALAARLVPAVALALVLAGTAVSLSALSDPGGGVSAGSLSNWSPVYRSRADLYDTATELNLSGFKLVYRKDTRYHHLVVVDDDDSRYLRFDSSFQSGMYLDDPYRTRFDYTDYFDLGLAYAPGAKSVLFVGLGGGSAPKRISRDFPQLDLQVVELDPDVVSVARRFFALPASIPVAVEDGRRWLERHDRRFDVIAIDAYYSDAVPFHMTTREFVQLVRSRLAPGGVVVVNAIGSLRGDGSQFLRALYRTYRSVFPTVTLHPVYDAHGGRDATTIRNVALVATESPAPEPGFLARRWAEMRAAHPGAPDLGPAIRNRWDEPVRVDDVPTLTDDYAPTDSLITGF